MNEGKNQKKNRGDLKEVILRNRNIAINKSKERKKSSEKKHSDSHYLPDHW